MPGQILGLLGKNGAGKSTLIEILCGLRQADSGSISVCGMNPAKESVGHLIGYAPQDLGIYPDLTVMENLAYYGQLEGLSRKRSFARSIRWTKKKAALRYGHYARTQGYLYG